MIKILNSWEELGISIGELQKENCGYHWDAMKNWDLAQVNELLKSCEKNARILDTGSLGSHALRFCYKRGFNNCVGIDLHISIEDRLLQARLMFKGKTLRRPYRLMKMNLMETTFARDYFDVILSISVIEHCVDLKSFLKESSRILKTGGTLLITTDYWDPKISINTPKPFDLKWNIFSRKEISYLIDLAKNYDLVMSNPEIPTVVEPFVHWLGIDYTFISLDFRKI